MWLINMSILKKNKYKFIFLNPLLNEIMKCFLNLQKRALFTKSSLLRIKAYDKIQIQTSGKTKIFQKDKKISFLKWNVKKNEFLFAWKNSRPINWYLFCIIKKMQKRILLFSKNLKNSLFHLYMQICPNLQNWVSQFLFRQLQRLRWKNYKPVKYKV